MSLELDHVFCLVSPEGRELRRLQDAGWALDTGTAHPGQGTRNRRLRWAGQYLELVWIEDDGEARANPLRLDRRAWWRRTGASPFGFGFRGQLSQDEDDRYWLYDALGVRIWVHRDNEQAPQRPLVFVLQMTGEDLQQRRRLGPTPDADVAEPPVLRWVQHRGPAPASIPRYDGPQITFSQGPHRLELVAGHGPPQRLSDILTVGGGE